MIIMGICELANNISLFEKSVGILYDYRYLNCIQLLSIHGFMLEFGRFFSFLIFLHSRYDSLDEGSARRKAATCAQESTTTE
jgi:hypothetical protein